MKDGAVFDGVGAKNGVGYKGPGTHSLSDQSHDFGKMFGGRIEDTDDWERQPGFHHLPGAVYRDNRGPKPWIAGDADEAECCGTGGL